MKQVQPFSAHKLKNKSYSELQKEKPLRTSEHIFVQAARGGQFSSVIKKALSEKTEMTVEDLTRKGKYDQTVVRILHAQDKLHQIFMPELWISRQTELQTLWTRHIPNSFKSSFDIDTFMVELNKAGFTKGRAGLYLKRRKKTTGKRPPKFKR